MDIFQRFLHTSLRPPPGCGFDLRRVRHKVGDIIRPRLWNGENFQLTPAQASAMRRKLTERNADRPPSAEVIDAAVHLTDAVSQWRNQIAEIGDVQ